MSEAKSYAVVCDPNDSELFRVHSATCKDLGRERMLERSGLIGGIELRQAATAEEALEAELREDFSDEVEHPAKDGYPGGSYGAAGFTGRVLPCAKARR